MKKEKYFDTKEEALLYSQKHPQYNKVPEYLLCKQKWAFVFPIKTILQKEEEFIMDNETKAFKWWRSLSINEMKQYEEKYKNTLYIIGHATNNDIVKIYNKEILVLPITDHQ